MSAPLNPGGGRWIALRNPAGGCLTRAGDCQEFSLGGKLWKHLVPRLLAELRRPLMDFAEMGRPQGIGSRFNKFQGAAAAMIGPDDELFHDRDIRIEFPQSAIAGQIAKDRTMMRSMCKGAHTATHGAEGPIVGSAVSAMAARIAATRLRKPATPVGG